MYFFGLGNIFVLLYFLEAILHTLLSCQLQFIFLIKIYLSCPLHYFFLVNFILFGMSTAFLYLFNYIFSVLSTAFLGISQLYFAYSVSRLFFCICLSYCQLKSHKAKIHLKIDELDVNQICCEVD